MRRNIMSDTEQHRLQEAHENGQAWYRWGPYRSERQWGTVREDYSPGGTAWDFLPHDQARSHAYRWGEDGLLAVETAETNLVTDYLAGRMRWFAENRPYVPHLIARWQDIRRIGLSKNYSLLAIVRDSDLEALLKRMLDPQEFLSDYGIRSLSKYHEAHPYALNTPYGNYSVNYEPDESTTGAFGGNSNWRGPIWFPINFLLVEALQKYHRFYGDDFT